MCEPGLHILYLTSFEMVMHCLKYSGKQSSTTNANMCCRFDLIIISTPKFRLFLCFQHQINELFYWISTRVIASIISMINPSCWLLLYPPLDDSDRASVFSPWTKPYFLVEQQWTWSHSASYVLYIHSAVIHVDISFVCLDTHTFDLCVPALSLE